MNRDGGSASRDAGIEFFNTGVVHHLIITKNDVIEVLDNEPPKVDILK